MSLSVAAAERLALLEGGSEAAAAYSELARDPRLSARERVELLSKATRCDPADAGVCEQLARALLAADAPARALDSARTATRLAPLGARCALTRARAASALGAHREAARVLERALRWNDDAARYNGDLARALAKAREDGGLGARAWRPPGWRDYAALRARRGYARSLAIALRGARWARSWCSSLRASTRGHARSR